MLSQGEVDHAFAAAGVTPRAVVVLGIVFGGSSAAPSILVRFKEAALHHVGLPIVLSVMSRASPVPHARLLHTGGFDGRRAGMCAVHLRLSGGRGAQIEVPKLVGGWIAEGVGRYRVDEWIPGGALRP